MYIYVYIYIYIYIYAQANYYCHTLVPAHTNQALPYTTAMQYYYQAPANQGQPYTTSYLILLLRM